MSGGSYEYLCFKDGEDIFTQSCLESLDAIANDLAKLGYADDVASEATELLLTIRSTKVRISSMKRRLDPVFKAMEWWKSCDYSEDGFLEALEKYRTNQKAEEE